MRIGLFMPIRAGGQQQQLPPAEYVTETAQLIEDVGLDGIWTLDTVAAVVQPRPDIFSWLLTAALATRSIEVGTGVLVVSNRNPVDVAHRMITIEQLLPGRFTYGVGAGSTLEADEAMGAVFEDRFKNLHKNMDTIRRLCRGEEVGAANLKAPADMHQPRFLLGAWASDISLKRAIREYDGWMSSGGRTKEGLGKATIGYLGEAIGRYHALGGTKRAFIFSVRIDLTVDAGPLGDDEPFNLLCPPEEASNRLRALADLGYDDISVFSEQMDRKGLDAIRGLVEKDTRPIE